MKFNDIVQSPFLDRVTTILMVFAFLEFIAPIYGMPRFEYGTYHIFYVLVVVGCFILGSYRRIYYLCGLFFMMFWLMHEPLLIEVLLEQLFRRH